MLPVVPAGQSHLQQLGAHGFAVRGHLCCALRVVPASIEQSHTEILKVGSAESTLLLFFCPCCANFWSVYAHRMCIGAYFWLQLC